MRQQFTIQATEIPDRPQDRRSQGSSTSGYLPDMEIVGFPRATATLSSSAQAQRRTRAEHNRLTMDELRSLASNAPKQGQNLSDHLVASIFEKQGCSEVFNLLAGFISHAQAG